MRDSVALVACTGAAARVWVTVTRVPAMPPTSTGTSWKRTRSDAKSFQLARLAGHVATASALAHWSGGGPPGDSFGALHRAVVDLHHAR